MYQLGIRPAGTSKTGATLTYEHVWQSTEGINTTYPEFFDGEGTVRPCGANAEGGMRRRRRDARRCHYVCLGRNVLLLKDVSQRSEVYVIAATRF